MRARVFGALGALALQAALILAVLFIVAFDRGFYSREYAKLGIYSSCGATSATLERATDITLNYLKNAAPDMSGKALIDGDIRDIFGADERAHMADVKRLLQAALAALIAAGILTIAFMLLSGRRGRASAQGALLGIGIFALASLAIGIWFACDFRGAFIAFHRLLFSNGLWLMNPNSQFMIRMFPSSFFEDMGLRMAGYIGGGTALEIAAICSAGFGGRKKPSGI